MIEGLHAQWIRMRQMLVVSHEGLRRLAAMAGSRAVRDEEDLVKVFASALQDGPRTCVHAPFKNDPVGHQARHIAENQPFVDGNKRTGLNAALVFLDLNGWVLVAPEMRLYDAMLALSSQDGRPAIQS